MWLGVSNALQYLIKVAQKYKGMFIKKKRLEDTFGWTSPKCYAIK